MKVLCVMPITRFKEELRNAPRPQVGDADKVTHTWRKPDTGTLYYYLERFGSDWRYHSECFAILPDQSADEMADQEKEAIVNLETAPS